MYSHENGPTLLAVVFMTIFSYHICLLLLQKKLASLLFGRFYDEKLSEQNRHKWNSSIMSSIHAILMAPICLYILVVDCNGPLDKKWLYRSEYMIFVGGISVGYVFCDTLHMFFNRNLSVDFLMGFHHIGFIMFYPFFILTPMGHEWLIFFIFTEISTPFLHIYHMLAMAGHNSGRLYLTTGLVFFTVFFLARVLPSPYYIYLFALNYNDVFSLDPISRYASIFASNAPHVLNFLWFSQMVVKLRRKMKVAKVE